MKDNGTLLPLISKIVPQALFRTFSQPCILPGQERDLINPHLSKVIEPVSITPIVARIPIKILVNFDP